MFQRPSRPDISTNLIIIGAGVTGLTMSKLLSTTELDFWLLGSPFESQLAKAGVLQNTSLAKGTVGLKFIESEFEKLKDSINHKSSSVKEIQVEGDGFRVRTKFQDFTCDSIIIATGKKQKALGFEGEDEYFRKGISDCTVCDYPLYRDRPVAVVGNHPYTVRAAQLMRKHSNQVSLLWYQKSSAPTVEGIDVYNNVSNLVASGDDVLHTITFTSDQGEDELNVNALFVEGEPEPNLSFTIEPELQTDPQGHILIDENFRTNLDHIYAVGDITGQTASYEGAKHHAEQLLKQLLQELTP